MHFLNTVAVALTAASSAYAAPMEKRAATVNELVGYAAGTTGGGSGAGTTVTTCAALVAAVKVGGVIKINGLLDGCDIIKVAKGDTSILGVGANSGLKNGGFQVRKVSNVIIRNLKLQVAPEGKDLIDIDESTKIWVDHCDFASVGMIGDKDTYDGLLDAKHGSDFLTFSWNKFHDHWKGSLVGHSDNNAAEDTGKLHVTYHHNLFENVNSRLPSVRFGTAHVYSSCYNNGPTSGINSRMGAVVFVEENSFTNTQLSIVTDLDSDLPGFASEKNNLYVNSPTRITQTKSLTVPYKYTIDAAAGVCAIVRKSAGTGIVSF